jgi:tagatose 1,6-diphosphate aldolase
VKTHFLDPGKLVDGELELLLVKTYPEDPSRGFSPAYKFILTIQGQGGDVGQLQLRVGNTEHIHLYAGHLGYSVGEKYRGNRYAARATKLILPLARKHDLNPLWITCNPDNIPSQRTCEILGAKFIEIVDLQENSVMYKRGERQKCRYRLDL